MEESAEQAVQIGVNATIFMIALTISITLMLGVKNVAEASMKADDNLNSNSIVTGIETEKNIVVSGSDIIPYYYNYISDKKISKSEKVVLEIYGKNGKIDMAKSGLSIKELVDQNIDMKKRYAISIVKYDKENDITNICIWQDMEGEKELQGGSIYSYISGSKISLDKIEMNVSTTSGVKTTKEYSIQELVNRFISSSKKYKVNITYYNPYESKMKVHVY